MTKLFLLLAALIPCLASAAANTAVFDNVIVNGLTANQTVVSNGSKKLSSLLYTSANNGSSICSRDSNGNSSFNNVNGTTTTVVTAGQTIAMNAGSARIQKTTGTSTATFKLPDATTLVTGWVYEFNQNTTAGNVTIQDNGANTLVTAIPGSYAYAILADNSTTNGVWDIHWMLPAQTLAPYGTAGLSVSGTLSASGAVKFSNYGAGACLFDSSGNVSSGVVPYTLGGTGVSDNTAIFNYAATNSSVYGGIGAARSFTGAYNTVIGPNAGPDLTSGTQNTLIGYGAGAQIASGSYNTAIGYGTVVSDGILAATVIGRNAQVNATYGICIGYGCTASGSSNIIIGANSGPQGAHTISLGANSGGGVGTYGIQIGESGYINTGKSGCIAIGHGVTCGQNSSISISPAADVTATSALSADNQFAIGDSRASVTEICHGKGCAALSSPVAVTEHPTDASGTNTAGANYTIRPGNGTGTGGSGKVIFQTAPAGSSGSTADTLANTVEINSNGVKAYNSSEYQFQIEDTSGGGSHWTVGASGGRFYMEQGGLPWLIRDGYGVQLNNPSGSPKWQLNSAPSDNSTSVADIVPGSFTHNLSLIMSQNPGSTVNNYSGYAFSGATINSTSTTAADGAILVVHEDHGVGTETGHMEFYVENNGGGLVKGMQIDKDAILRLPVQGSGSTPACADDGRIALTHGHILCVCDGSAWKKVSDGSTTCTF